MGIKGVIFDLDGTLTNTLSLCVSAFRRAIEPLSGRMFSDAEIIATFGPTEEGTIMALIPDRFDDALAAYLDAYHRLIEATPIVFAGIEPMLIDLRGAGLRLGVVTGKGTGSTALTLSSSGLHAFFSDVETGSPTGSIKARRLTEIIGRWQLAADEVLYVGDAPTDVTAAREAGCRVVAAAWSAEADPVVLSAMKPDAVLYSIGELSTWLGHNRISAVVRLAQQVQAIAQTGLTFSKDRYDIERYEALRTIAAELISGPSTSQREVVLGAFKGQLGYATPKVDVRAIILKAGRVLLVREAADGLWSLPGGWADVGDRPSVAICREVQEETGLTVSVDRLLGVWDCSLHGHAPYPFHAYKMIFHCRETGGEVRSSADTLGAEFFDPAMLPELSLTRVVPIEITTSVELILANGPAYLD